MRLLFITFLWLQSFLTFGQIKIELKGTVTSSSVITNLGYVAITVFDANTNKLITHSYSDEVGNYKISIKKEAKVYIKADLLGYKSYTSDHFIVVENTIKNIVLIENIEELDEVEIFQKKKLIKLKGDKLIYNVELAGIGEGNNGLETISKLPGMRLDKDENIVFRGNGNLQVMINGKRSLLSGEALNQYLKTLGGENLKKIEIIVNPSARYDASGTAGIINIELKKGKNIGLTGSLYSSIGGEYFKNSNGLNLYYQSGNWNINFGTRYAINNSINEREIIREITSITEVKTLEQLNDWLPKATSYSGKFGVEYSINKNAIIGTSWNYNIYNSDNKTIGKTNEYLNWKKLRFTLLDEFTNEKDKTLTSNIYYNYASDSLTTKLNMQLNYANYNNDKFEQTKNEYFLLGGVKYQDDFTIRLNNPTRYHVLNAIIDLEHQLNESFKVETGVKYSYVNNDYNNQYAIQNVTGVFQPNIARSNHLLYKEKIFSSYGIVSWSSEKWSLQGGLRSESINYKATSITNNKNNTKSYTSWFPSLSINKVLKNDKLQFSYSKRIQRPRYLDLNPFYEYLDTYNVSVGNPDLQPQFTNAFNFSWIHKQKTSVSLYSNFNSDVIYYKVAYDPVENITVNSQDNIASSTNIGLSFSTSIRFKEWWDINFNNDFSYTRMKSDIVNYEFDDQGYNWYVNINNEFSLRDKWKLFFEGFYNHGGVYGNWNNKSSYDISIRMRKVSGNDKWKFQLKGDNLLKKSLFSSVVTQGNVVTNWTNKWETRRISFSVTYNFGDGKKKSIKQADLLDEKKRL
ncbi:TonB-dependent receptor domain-containing protein [Tenacibaculum halocynthiae]|uniref:TonB-dependent receptor domain-containing protein n=1 Tax=Tenacibaculum halocynthiae TaxID=1254437 RepID=UPI003894D798